MKLHYISDHFQTTLSIQLKRGKKKAICVVFWCLVKGGIIDHQYTLQYKVVSNTKARFVDER